MTAAQPRFPATRQAIPAEVYALRDGRSFARLTEVWWQLTDHEGRPALTGATEPLDATPIPPSARTPTQVALLVCLQELYDEPDVTEVLVTDDEVFIVTDAGSVFSVKRGESIRLFRRPRLPPDARPSVTGDPVLRSLAEACAELDVEERRRQAKVRPLMRRIVDMPDELQGFFVQLCLVHGFQLPGEARGAHFAALTDEQVHQLEQTVKDVFTVPLEDLALLG